ncbi:MAG: NAD(+) kinase [Crocinitomicaceae bacterium]|nr:NAD(+) kinase [Crocinitomicaceae bacterium]
MRVAIYGRKVSKHSAEYFTEMLKYLEDFGWEAVLEEDLKALLVSKIGISEKYQTFKSHLDFKSGIDLTISMGGDGTFLKTVSYIQDSGVPIMGINMGRLGFLANISKEQIHHTLTQVKEKQFEFQKRSLLRVFTEEDIFGKDNFALNELTLHKKDLSCGGPIITPGCQVHILTPIAPHNLNVRPVVVPDHLPITLSVEGRDRTYLLSLDGNSKSIKQGEEVIIKKAEFMINVIKFEDNNFLDTIRNKMMWGIDTRN